MGSALFLCASFIFVFYWKGICFTLEHTKVMCCFRKSAVDCTIQHLWTVPFCSAEHCGAPKSRGPFTIFYELFNALDHWRPPSALPNALEPLQTKHILLWCNHGARNTRDADLRHKLCMHIFSLYFPL